LLHGQESEARSSVRSRVVNAIDDHAIVTLKNNVRQDVAAAPDLGPVEDSRELHLYMLLQRTPEQQADLENLLERQQQAGAAEYHKWLTPKAFGARFGASPEDIAKINTWLESHGMQVRSVLNNGSMIDFAATSGQIREAFRTQLHYVEMRGGKYPALRQDPSIPAALAPVVAGIKGLNKIPALMDHTTPGRASFNKGTKSWHRESAGSEAGPKPAYDDGTDTYLVTPQDFYTIYNVNPVFNSGTLGSTSTVAVVEESDIEYGTVNSSTHAATGGDVTTFRSLFGVPGTLNMHVYHGYGSVTCNDPGIDPNANGEDVEASLDAEWANATAPSANLVFMSCDDTTDNGIFTSMAALIDNSLSDVMSLSYGESELYFTSSSDYNMQDTLYAQAAAQGQTFFVSSGDSGSDVKDQNTEGAAVSGINVSAFASPLTTVAGGTDFQDYYDSFKGGPAETTYWSSANNSHYGSALSYVPEMPWNSSCASSMVAAFEGYSGAGLCATGDFTNGDVVGGSGGISTHYSVPSWQTGTSGYSNSKHSQPDIAGFASSGGWGHGLIFCDSNPRQGYTCASSATFGVAGGTSFVAPYMAGVTGLLVNYTGARQGLLNPALYALAKAQYTAAATKTACYANGQTSNTGVTTGLPASSCIFADVTTGNNDVPCAAGSASCYVNSGASYGMLSLTGSSSLTAAYQSGIGFDQVTGLGSVNVNNLLTKWNTAFTSSTTVSANPTSITSSQSTTLTATVTTGTPTGYDGTKPATKGTATFKAGTSTLGSCTMTAGSCSLAVAASKLASGANSVTATYAGSGTYPASTSTATTVTVTGGGTTKAAITSPTPGSTLTSSTVTFTWTAATGATTYALNLGSTGANSSNLYNSGHITTTTATATGLPTNGETVYAELWAYVNNAWVTTNYTYTAENKSAAITSPAAGSTFTSTSVTFTWSPAAGATTYALNLGSTGANSSNLYNSGHITTTTATATGLPTNGETVYAELWAYVNNAWVTTNYTYKAESKSAAITSPTPGSTLTGSTVTFTWSPAAGATTYALNLGSTGANSSNLYNSGHITTTSATATGLPTNGEAIYAELWAFVNNAWVTTNYTYTAK
jgi:hypothetical protein